MMNEFDFCGFTVAVRGLPDTVPTGSFLEQFRTERPPDVTVEVTVGYNGLAEDVRNVPGRIAQKDGKTWYCATFCNSLETVWYAPEDWKGNLLKVWISPQTLADENFSLNQLLSLIGLPGGMLYRQILTFHCAYIVYRGGAILFAAPSGTGKSTQAELWRRYCGAEVINGDRALILTENGKWLAGGISVCGSSDICKKRTAPLRAIVLLHQGTENAVTPASAAQKYRALLGGAAYHRWIPEEGELAMALCEAVLEDVPIISYQCRPDRDAVETLLRSLEECL